MAVIGRDQIGSTAAAAARAGGRLSRLLPGSAAPRLVEIGLAAVLAALLALTVLKIASPLPVPKTPAVPAPAVAAGPAAAKNPFTLADAAPPESAGPATPEAAETTLDLMLHGTWVDAERGAAIIRTPDGEQHTFIVGDTICCGAKLEGVYPDQVIITRNGVRESLRLPNKREISPPPQPAVAAPETAPSAEHSPADVKSLAQIVRFRPAPDGSGGVRLALHPADDRRAFEALGLREGDILVSVNGAPAPTGLDGVSQLLSTLAGAESVMIAVDRDGAPTSVEISLASES
ncbi:MAG: type II secretion system protein N [Amphiplicatus sp.]